MATLGGDQVLLFGGYDAGGLDGLDGETWVYDLSANTWTEMAPAAAPSARYYHAMASVGGDQVLLFGGGDYDHCGDSWVYDLSANTWTEMAPAAAPSPRSGHAMATLGGDAVLLFAGYDGVGTYGDTWLAADFYRPYRVYLPLVIN